MRESERCTRRNRVTEFVEANSLETFNSHEHTHTQRYTDGVAYHNANICIRSQPQYSRSEKIKQNGCVCRLSMHLKLATIRITKQNFASEQSARAGLFVSGEEEEENRLKTRRTKCGKTTTTKQQQQQQHELQDKLRKFRGEQCA